MALYLSGAAAGGRKAQKLREPKGGAGRLSGRTRSRGTRRPEGRRRRQPGLTRSEKRARSSRDRCLAVRSWTADPEAVQGSRGPARARRTRRPLRGEGFGLRKGGGPRRCLESPGIACSAAIARAVNTVLDGSMARMLFRGRGSIEFHQRTSRQELEDTNRQLRQKKRPLRKVARRTAGTAEELRGRGREAKLKVTFGTSSPAKAADGGADLPAGGREEAGVSQQAASERRRGGSVTPEQEFQIAQEEIVAVPWRRSPTRGTADLQAAAKRYRFAEDWYVLAGGQGESDHGKNRGPSSAGAMGDGHEQFLPSTWAQYGVDGNGDGEAKDKDPEGRHTGRRFYLVVGGAPDDCTRALTPTTAPGVRPEGPGDREKLTSGRPSTTRWNLDLAHGH